MKNAKQALTWAIRSAQQGNADAQRRAGAMYANGTGAPQDYREAKAWGLKAAEQGDSKSQFLVGKWYAKGQVVAGNKVEAHKWLNLAATGGIDEARVARGELELTMSKSEVADAQRLASAWSAAHK